MYHVIHIFYVHLQPQHEKILRISLKRLCNLLDESIFKNFVVRKIHPLNKCLKLRHS